MSVISAEDTTDIMVSDANQTLTTENSSILEETENIEATQDSVVDDKDGVSNDIATTYTVSSYDSLVSTITDITVNTGSVVFKLNGKTIATVEVTNGVATYNYTITTTLKIII